MRKKEIEFKFLVDHSKFHMVVKESYCRAHIKQAYIQDSKVRVRNVIQWTNGVVLSKKSWLTIKGIRQDINRDEFEYEIPYDEGVALLECLGGNVIEKTRYFVKYDGGSKLKWEVDDFHGDNHGLIMAEIEVPKEDFTVSLPDWIVPNSWAHDDEKFYNRYLSKNPYSAWPQHKQENDAGKEV